MSHAYFAEEHRSYSHQNFQREERSFAVNHAFRYENQGFERRPGCDAERNLNIRFMEDTFNHRNHDVFRYLAGPEMGGQYRSARHLPYFEIVNPGLSNFPGCEAGREPVCAPETYYNNPADQVRRDLVTLDRTARDVGAVVNAFEVARNWIQRTETGRHEW